MEITDKVSIWAVPNLNKPKGIEFKVLGWAYEPWQEGSVKVDEQEVTLTISDNINYLEKAIETLENKIVKAKSECEQTVRVLQDEIKKLRRLEHIPDEI